MIEISPDEVIKQLNNLGVKMSRSTLWRATNDELGPMPMTGGGGRGYGRWSDYPSDAYIDFYASHILVKKSKMDVASVAKARKAVFNYTYAYWSEWNYWRDNNVNVRFTISKGCLENELYKVYSTPGALQWYEIHQSVYGKIDDAYIELLDYEPGIHNITFQEQANMWIPMLREILQGLEQIVQTDDENRRILNALLHLIRTSPEMSSKLMLYARDDIPFTSIQFLLKQKLPL